MLKHSRPRILLADDFPPFLEQAEKFLGNDYEIVGVARDGREALNLCLTLKPDILLLDLAMPILSGLEVASRLKERRCRSQIVFVTGQKDHDYVETAFSLGASGYVLKSDLGPMFFQPWMQHSTAPLSPPHFRHIQQALDLFSADDPRQRFPMLRT